MNINISKIKEIYGEEILNDIRNSIEDVNKNISYLVYLKFTDVEDIVERVTPLFINDFASFKFKIDSLIKKLGSNYVEQIEEDISLLEDLLW